MNNFNKKKILFIAGIILSLFVTTNIFYEYKDSKKYEVNIKKFNVIPNDQVEDTVKIQKAVDFMSKRGGGIIRFPKGLYLIDATKSIKLKDNITLKFEKGSILKAIPNSADGYEILSIHNVKRVNILGSVEIIGERDEHIGKTGEWGIGIGIKGSNTIRIEGSTIKDCWGDGIYVGKSDKVKYSKNISIKNVKLENNRRQGISIVSVIKMRMLNISASNTNGTKPSSGIDLEPNSPDEYLEDIEIINLSTINNEGYGLLLAIGRLSESENQISIKIVNTENITDNIGIFVPNRIKGKIKLGDEYILNTMR